MSNSKLENIGRYEYAEHLFVDQFGGKKVLDLEIQFKGVDIIYKDDVTTIQIKDELKSSKKTGNIFVEKVLENSATGNKIAGGFESDQADKLVFLIYHPIEEKPFWLGGSYSCFRKFNKEKSQLWKSVTVRNTTVDFNKALGYKYTRPHGEIIKIEDAIQHKDEYGFVLTPLAPKYCPTGFKLDS